MAITIRVATPPDLPGINAIYNHYVACSTCTYQVEPSTEQERRQWYDAHGLQHPITVAEADGRIVGWGALNPFHARAGYDRTVEDSVYIHHDWHRKGIGRAVLGDLIKRARDLGHHTVIASISADQFASVEMHRVCGFETVAHLTEVGSKFGRLLDLVYMQLML